MASNFTKYTARYYVTVSFGLARHRVAFHLLACPYRRMTTTVEAVTAYLEPAAAERSCSLSSAAPWSSAYDLSRREMEVEECYVIFILK
eukprot:SAG31_NODE_14057_length_829_cov_2.231507_1_plen_88_part_01